MTDRALSYVNTDLDVISASDVTTLAAAFEAGGMVALHVDRREDGLWYGRFETEGQFDEPERNIAAMMAVVEALRGPLLAVWAKCTRREFNIGYECGSQPRAIEQRLSRELLSRIAAAGGSLGITLYAPDSDGQS